eukprot:12642627-Alexandrium_andersonii.AAC.1
MCIRDSLTAEPELHELQALSVPLELQLVVEGAPELARNQLVESARSRFLVEGLAAGHLQLPTPDFPLGGALAQLRPVFALVG